LKPVLVTGATGFLGWHVARRLLERGYRVRALVRDPKRLRDLEVEAVAGDLRDSSSVERAVSGCGLIFHVAADYRLWSKNPSELYASNVEGTVNVFAAAQKAAVERVVYTSTVGCIGVPANKVGNEEQRLTLDEVTGAYKRSKFLAEQAALRCAREGLPVVIVNPTAPVGDHDFKPTPTGKIVVDFLRGKMPAYVDTGLNLVDARDTAEGHILACERGRPGERYILGSENLTLRQIFERLERISGQPAPSVRLPYAAAYAFGVLSTVWAEVSGVEPRAPLDAVRMARKKMFVTHEKAARELGYRPGGAEPALQRAVEWFRTNGYA
jgi:dihydroflavonol-4-reductase